jgi:hypothetical protein
MVRSILFIILMAAVLALTSRKVAAADDKDQISPQPQAQQFADPAAGGAVASQREWEYLTALQKCELRTGAERTKCVDATRNKYGQM